MYSFEQLVNHYKSGYDNPLPGLKLKNTLYDRLFKQICLKLSENTLESFNVFNVQKNADNDIVLYKELNRRDNYHLKITFSLDALERPIAYLSALSSVKGFLEYFYRLVSNNSSFIKENIETVIDKTQSHFLRYNLASFDEKNSTLLGDEPFNLKTFFRIPHYANDSFPMKIATINYSSLTLSFNRFFNQDNKLDSYFNIQSFLVLSMMDDKLQVGCRLYLPDSPFGHTNYFIDLLNPISQDLVDHIDKQSAKKCHEFICLVLAKHNLSSLKYREIKELDDLELKAYIDLVEMTCLS